MPIGRGPSTGPEPAHLPNILNLRQLSGGQRLARRLQADRRPFAFKDRAVPSIASDVNSASSFVQSASQQRSPTLPTAQQADAQPFTALLDAASQQQTSAQANPPTAPASGSLRRSGAFQSNSSSKSSAAATDSSNPAPAQTSQGPKSQPAAMGRELPVWRPPVAPVAVARTGRCGGGLLRRRVGRVRRGILCELRVCE